MYKLCLGGNWLDDNVSRQGDKINDDHLIIAGLHVPTCRDRVRFVNLNYVLTLIAALREELRSNYEMKDLPIIKLVLLLFLGKFPFLCLHLRRLEISKGLLYFWYFSTRKPTYIRRLDLSETVKKRLEYSLKVKYTEFVVKSWAISKIRSTCPTVESGLKFNLLTKIQKRHM